MSRPLSPMSLPAPKQLKFTPGIVNGSISESASFLDHTRKVVFLLAAIFFMWLFCLFNKLKCQWIQMVPVGQLSIKKLAAVGQSGKLWRWKRSHHQWLLQFKWKWQKPWKLSEWIKHSDETIMRSRPRRHALVDIIWQHLCTSFLYPVHIWQPCMVWHKAGQGHELLQVIIWLESCWLNIRKQSSFLQQSLSSLNYSNKS